MAFSIDLGQAFHPPGEVLNSLALANNQFGLDLYRTFITPDSKQKNCVLSPFSIFTALAMLDVGARGATRDEILTTLKLKGSSTVPEDQIDAGFKFFFSYLDFHTFTIANNTKSKSPTTTHKPSSNRAPKALGPAKPEPTVMNLANRVYLQTGLPVDPKFQSTVQTNYLTDLGRIDFKAKNAQNEINQWVKTVTIQKIFGVFSKELAKTNKLILVSAFNFEAAWEHKFNEKNTHDADFFLDSGKTMKVSMMEDAPNDSQLYAEFPDQDATAYMRSYAKGSLRMIFILPNKKDGLDALEKSLTTDFFSGALYQLVQVSASIPKFQIEVEPDNKLTDGLKGLGIKQAFTPNADFSGISAEKNLMLGDVFHKVMIGVDETGTCKPASTAGEGTVGGASDSESERKVFKADHPFLFAIQHSDTQAILFLGRVERPNMVRNVNVHTEKTAQDMTAKRS